MTKFWMIKNKSRDYVLTCTKQWGPKWRHNKKNAEQINLLLYDSFQNPKKMEHTGHVFVCGCNIAHTIYSGVGLILFSTKV